MARKPNADPPAVLPNGHDKPQDDAGITVDDPAIETEIDAGATAQPAAASTAPVTEDPGLVKLREDLAAANRRAEEAETRLTRERAERGKDQEVLQDSRLLVIDSTIQTNETKLEAAKKRAKEAMEAGDFDAQVNAQAEIAEITLNLKQAKMGKDRLEQEIEQAKTAPKAPQTEEEKFTAWADANNIHPKSRAWLRGHMEYLERPAKNAALIKAHFDAIEAGHAPNSQAYFDAIEETLGLKAGSEATDTRRETTAPAAPVSRDTTPNNGAGRRVSDVEGITDLGNGKYRVTPAIADAASIAGIPIKQYVEEALKLKRGSDGLLH